MDVTNVNKKGLPKKSVMRILNRAYTTDMHFRDGRIFGSMCTEPHQIARSSHAMFFETNLGNPGLCPGTRVLEAEVINMISGLLHGKKVAGHIVNGGNEANITALWIARNNNRRRKKVLFAKSAHFSIQKACDLLGLTPVTVPMDRNYRLDAEILRKKISDDVCSVVAVAGTTELGAVDPIEEISEICAERCVNLHVDAAFGGFVLPFLEELGYPIELFDFRCGGVCSISADPHKMGLATIPSGCLLVRDTLKMKRIAVRTPYLTSEMQTSLSGTRASGAVAGTYAVMKLLGREGYRKIVKRCMNNTEYLLNEAKKIGFEPVLDPPPMNILCLKTKRPEKICSELMRRGWVASVAVNPRSLRLVIMPHVTRTSIDNFIPELKRAYKQWSR